MIHDFFFGILIKYYFILLNDMNSMMVMISRDNIILLNIYLSIQSIQLVDELGIVDWMGLHDKI